MPIKNCFLFCYGPVGLMDTSSAGFQSQVFQGLIPGDCLKVGVLDVGPNPSLLRQKLEVGGSLPIVWHWAESEIYSESVSQPFLLTLGHCLSCRSHWASFWTFLRGNCSVCGCTFCVSKGGRKFRSLLSLSLSLFIIRKFFNYRKMQGNTQKLMGTCQKKQEPA